MMWLAARGLAIRVLGAAVWLGMAALAPLVLVGLAAVWIIKPDWVIQAVEDALPEEDDGDHGGYDHGLRERHR